VGLTLSKWIPLKVMSHTLILSNKKMSVEDSIENRVSIAFLIIEKGD